MVFCFIVITLIPNRLINIDEVNTMKRRELHKKMKIKQNPIIDDDEDNESEDYEFGIKTRSKSANFGHKEIVEMGEIVESGLINETEEDDGIVHTKIPIVK